MKKGLTGLFFLLSGIILFISCKNHSTAAAGNDNPLFQKNAALKAVTTEINANPKNAALYYNRGELLHKMQLDTLAIEDYKKAASLDSTKAEYYSAVGDILFDHKDIAGSVEWLQRAMKLNPKDVKTHLKIANLFVYTNDAPKAFAEINEVLRQDVYNPEAYFLKGILYKDLKDTNKAISSFQTALSMNPRYKNAIAELGELYSSKKDKLALQYFDNLFKLDTTDVFPLYAQGMFYQEQDMYDDAKAAYKNCVNHDPQYADAYFAMGWILMHQDSLDKAWRQYDLVTKIAPTNAGAYYNRGLCDELLHKKQDAVNDYKQALVFKKDYKEAQDGLNRLKAK